MNCTQKCYFSLLFITLLFSESIFSQEWNWIYYADKTGSSFNPTEYFDIKAIERRINTGISLIDSSDFPINEQYIKIITENTDSSLYHSRWLNASAVLITKAQADYLKTLPFVKKIAPIAVFANPCQNEYDTTLSAIDKSILNKQLNNMEGSIFSSGQIYGTGIRIAIFDTGFPFLNDIPVFEHLVKNKRIIKTYDFAKNKELVYDFNPHGTSVLSCITGKIGSIRLGLATDAEFLLARTETNREIAQEEVYWVAALEWADKNGAQIVNSSLGYTYHRYFPEEMDGKTSVVAQAAQIAARKGILIVNSMGNDGNNEWKVLATPADADSILSVGAVEAASMLHSNFSSFGPTADFRLKPNIVANGKVVAAGTKSLQTLSGTSFAAPLITGFAACVWQLFPHYSNMDIINEIQKSASLYPYFDYAHGYGIPKAGYFFGEKNPHPKESFQIEIQDQKIYLIFSSTQNFKGIGSNYLYFHLADENNKIIEYWVVELENTSQYQLPIEKIDDNQNIRVFFRGTMKTINKIDL
jgi:subtilisin family serine protease